VLGAAACSCCGPWRGGARGRPARAASWPPCQQAGTCPRMRGAERGPEARGGRSLSRDGFSSGDRAIRRDVLRFPSRVGDCQSWSSSWSSRMAGPGQRLGHNRGAGCGGGGRVRVPARSCSRPRAAGMQSPLRGPKSCKSFIYASSDVRLQVGVSCGRWAVRGSMPSCCRGGTTRPASHSMTHLGITPVG
jgi:hypothetical protein